MSLASQLPGLDISSFTTVVEGEWGSFAIQALHAVYRDAPGGDQYQALNFIQWELQFFFKVSIEKHPLDELKKMPSSKKIVAVKK